MNTTDKTKLLQDNDLLILCRFNNSQNNNLKIIEGMNRQIQLLGLSELAIPPYKNGEIFKDIIDISQTIKEYPCSICYEHIPAGQKIVTECKHVFHSACIRTWMAFKVTCPLCRRDISYLQLSSAEFWSSGSHEVDETDEQLFNLIMTNNGVFRETSHLNINEEKKESGEEIEISLNHKFIICEMIGISSHDNDLIVIQKNNSIEIKIVPPQREVNYSDRNYVGSENKHHGNHTPGYRGSGNPLWNSSVTQYAREFFENMNRESESHENVIIQAENQNLRNYANRESKDIAVFHGPPDPIPEEEQQFINSVVNRENENEMVIEDLPSLQEDQEEALASDDSQEPAENNVHLGYL